MTTVISIGAVTNQLVPSAPAGMAFSDQGIHFPDGTEQTTAAVGGSMRKFYLTATAFNGDRADGTGVCANGFHFAWIWEIREPSNLEYVKSEGLSTLDSGEGPPAEEWGWIRTGWDQPVNTLTLGKANCGSSSPWDTTIGNGSQVSLSSDWFDAARLISPWLGSVTACTGEESVWCVEDYPGSGSE